MPVVAWKARKARPHPSGPPRGPHPSWLFNGNSPKPAKNPDPQFRRLKLRATRPEAGRGQETLPRRDWLKGVAEGRKSRRATSAGSESSVSFQVPALGGFSVPWSCWGCLLAEVSGAPRLGGQRERSGPQGLADYGLVGRYRTETACARDTPTRHCASRAGS